MLRIRSVRWFTAVVLVNIAAVSVTRASLAQGVAKKSKEAE